MLHDLRFSFRLLRRAPGFYLLAILCLTLGIGANTAVFSWIEGVLLRPYPVVKDQDRLVVLGGTAVGGSRYLSVSWPDLQDFRQQCTLFDSFIVSRLVATTLSIGERAERTAGEIVSANYFEALGAPVARGRGFLATEEYGRNAHPVVVISDQLWRERFHADPSIIGQTQILNGQVHTIVGVAAAGFRGTFSPYSVQFWVPASMQERFIQAAICWRIAAAVGLKDSRGSRLACRASKPRPKSPPWRGVWNSRIRRPTAAAACACCPSGNRRSIAPRFYFRR